MLIRKSRFTGVMMWAMIPLIVFGSLPRVGCICANGQHKFFCERHRQGTAAGECVCCDHTTATRQPMARSKAAPGAPAPRVNVCCRSHAGQSACDGPAFDTGRPCRPVVDRAVLLTAARASLDLDHSDHTPLFVAVEFFSASSASLAADDARGEPLPPPDLVITLGVMLI